MNTRLDEATVRAVAGLFAQPIVDVEVIGHGLVNDTFVVTSTNADADDARAAKATGRSPTDDAAGGGRFVLQRVNPDVFADAHKITGNIAAFRAHLVARGSGMLVPAVHPTLDGRSAIEVDGATWRAWEWVDGFTVSTPTVHRVASAAALLGGFHNALDDLDPAALEIVIDGFHDVGRRAAQFRDAAAADPIGRATTARDVIDALAAHTDLCGFADRLTDSTDRSVAHNDAKLANFLFRDDRAICLVDLDTVMEGAAYFDVADLIRSGTSKADEDDPEAAAHGARAELVDAILDSYTRARSSTTPRENLEVATLCVVYEQALRFATDHVLGDAYYRTTRPRQNLDRARGQLVLLESLRVLFGR